jgi:hypothetical protein
MSASNLYHNTLNSNNNSKRSHSQTEGNKNKKNKSCVEVNKNFSSKAAKSLKKSNDIDQIFSSIKSTSKQIAKPAESSAVCKSNTQNESKPEAASANSSDDYLSDSNSDEESVDQQSLNNRNKKRAQISAYMQSIGAPEDDLGFTRGGSKKKLAGNSYSADNLKVVDIDSLGMGKGGDTADCPFDCQCCF